MDFESYPMQILIVIAKECRPNSPYPDRTWMNLKPPHGIRIPELSRARLALVRSGLVIDAIKDSWKVRPTPLGYVLLESWRQHRKRLRERPILYDPVVSQTTIVDQRFIRRAA